MMQGAQLWQPRNVGGGREVQKRGEHMYTYGWFMFIYGRNQHNIVIILQLKPNW